MRSTGVTAKRVAGIRTVRRYIAQQAAMTNGRPLHVLDIGPGACETALGTSAWARRHGLDVRFACMDTRPTDQLPCRANEDCFHCRDPAVTMLQGEIFSYLPDEPYDCAIVSMPPQRLAGANAVLLVMRLRRFVRAGVLLRNSNGRLASLLASWRRARELLGHLRGVTVNIQRTLLDASAIVAFR